MCGVEDTLGRTKDLGRDRLAVAAERSPARYHFRFEGFEAPLRWARSDAATSFCLAVDLGSRRILLASDAGFFPVVMELLLLVVQRTTHNHRFSRLVGVTGQSNRAR
jgi:hypothetical protein